MTTTKTNKTTETIIMHGLLSMIGKNHRVLLTYDIRDDQYGTEINGD